MAISKSVILAKARIQKHPLSFPRKRESDWLAPILWIPYQVRNDNAGIEMNGKEYKSPSAAAVYISGHPEDGWRMWRYLDELNNEEQLIDGLRRI